eukprot:1196274-Prorocentrum_minimum.AAC.6
MLPLPINVGQDGKPKHNTVRSIPIRDRRAGVAGVATEDMTKGKFEYQVSPEIACGRCFELPDLYVREKCGGGAADQEGAGDERAVPQPGGHPHGPDHQRARAHRRAQQHGGAHTHAHARDIY